MSENLIDIGMREIREALERTAANLEKGYENARVCIIDDSERKLRELKQENEQLKALCNKLVCEKLAAERKLREHMHVVYGDNASIQRVRDDHAELHGLKAERDHQNAALQDENERLIAQLASLREASLYAKDALADLRSGGDVHLAARRGTAFNMLRVALANTEAPAARETFDAEAVRALGEQAMITCDRCKREFIGYPRKHYTCPECANPTSISDLMLNSIKLAEQGAKVERDAVIAFLRILAKTYEDGATDGTLDYACETAKVRLIRNIQAAIEAGKHRVV